jgi:two-component system, NtrC family, response regulator AtoC
MRETLDVLIVDDDEVTRQLLQEVLERDGFRISTASSGEMAVKMIRQKVYPIIVSDIRMLELDGLAVLRESKIKSQASAVVLMTGFGSMEGAIEAVRSGAFDYVSKPFRLEQIQSIVQRAARHWENLAGQALRRTARNGGQDAMDPDAGKLLIGRSPRIIEVYKALAHATLAHSSVLLRGESGSGKSLVARAIHENGHRNGKPFVSWAGLSNGHSSELHEFVRLAGEGTLYIEEVARLSPLLQAELLNLIEEERAPCRIIAATQMDLDQEVREERFRGDLFYLLRVISIDLPPLRERMEDLPDLVEAFVTRYSRKNGKAISHVSPEAMNLFGRYRWPGNIRELEHAIERAIVMTGSSVLFPEDFPGLLAPSQLQAAGPSGEGSLESLERQHILRVLSETSFNKSKASEVLGIDRATLYRKAQRYGIDLRSR